MNTYKVVSELLAHVKNENGEDAHFVIHGGFKKGLPVLRVVDVYKKEVGTIAKGLSFHEAKETRLGHKGSWIVKE